MRDYMSAVKHFFTYLVLSKAGLVKTLTRSFWTYRWENRNIYEYESDQLQQSGILTLPHTNTPNSKLRQYAANLHSIHSSFIGVTAPWRSVKWIAGASYCFSHHSSIYPQMYLLPNQGSWLVNLISGCLCWNMQFS